MESMILTSHRGLGIFIGKDVYRKVRIYKGRPLADAPRSYRRVGCFTAEELYRPWYQSGIVTVYKNSHGTLRYETYIDGSIYPFYGKLEIIE